MTERKKISIAAKTTNMLDASSPFQFEAQPTQHSAIPVKGKGSKKNTVPLVQPADRRFTRSQAKLKGFKAPPVRGVPVSRPKKKSRKIIPPSATQAPNSPKPQGGDSVSIRPATPIPILQKIGSLLEMDPNALTAEKLNAPLASDATAEIVPDEEWNFLCFMGGDVPFVTFIICFYFQYLNF
jgi:hypothetical protein